MKAIKKDKPILAKKITLYFLAVSILLTVVSIIISIRFVFPGMIDITLNKNRYIATAITNQLDDYLKSLINLINTTVNSKPFRDAIHTYENSSEDIELQKSSINLLIGTYVHNSGFCRRLVFDDFENNTQFSSIGATNEVDELIFQDEDYKQIINNNKRRWTSSILKKQGSNDYTMAYSMRINIDNKAYIATAFIDVTIFIEYVNETHAAVFDDFVFYDTYGNILVSSPNFDIPSEYEKSNNIYQYIINLEDSPSEHYISVLGDNNYVVFVGYVTDATLFRDFQAYFIVIVILFILIIIIADLIMLPVIHKKLLPLQDLSSAMQDISSGKINSRPHLNTGDEITTLCDIFNNMLDTLQENTDELIEREKERNKMKYSLLISQLDPHFLFNTMNIINSLARSKKK